MEMENVGFDVLLGVAIKSEIESSRVYEHLSQKARNFIARDRFTFLAQEERKHEKFLRDFFKRLYPDREPEVKDDVRVPLPSIEYTDDTPVPDILEQAMRAEKVAEEFYTSMAEKARKAGNEELSVWLNYLANMEKSHYFLLEGELEMARNFGVFDTYWEMMHAGP